MAKRASTAVSTRQDGRPTSYDVAQLAGVSQSAVSRCFRPGSSIAPATRARVLAAAKTLGYHPNAMASGLITKRSNLVAVIISNLTNLYYPEVLSGLTRRLSDRGIRLLLFTLQAESEIDTILDQIWRYRVDGTIVAARLSPAHLAEFARHQVPVVLYNRVGEGEMVASVCCDSVAGESMLCQRLFDSGHRVFGMIAGPGDSAVSDQRVEGARRRLGELGLPLAVVEGAYDYDSGGSGLETLLRMTGDRLDALVCANDLMAIGAIDAARHRFGLSVPDRLSIVGFDGVAPAAWDSYRLSTIRQPVSRMTEAAVQMLLERIEDGELPGELRTFSGTLIEGASARL